MFVVTRSGEVYEYVVEDEIDKLFRLYEENKKTYDKTMKRINEELDRSWNQGV